jgi:peptidoglycan/LPS O-acetylase OafA/YrhL
MPSYDAAWRGIEGGREARDNSFGLLRLVLASSVIISHAYVLSGRFDEEFVMRFSGGQQGLGGLAVAGFFVVSGFLVTASVMNASPARYAWRRFIRIFPGYWACLLVTAFVFAPLTWVYERGLAGGFLDAPQGPWDYLRSNAFIGIRQYGISGLLLNTPFGVQTGSSVFDGSLWSLIYEVICYVALGLLALTLLKRAPRLTAAVVAAALYLVVLTASILSWSPAIALPLVGLIHVDQLIVLGFCFALGAVFHVFKSSIPLHPIAGLAAATILLGSLYFRFYPVVGPIALAYLLIWLAFRLPRGTRRIGVKNDYSYGIYIFAFPIQQSLAEVGVAHTWLPLYTWATFLLTVPLAMLSWHVVEKRALMFRDVSFGRHATMRTSVRDRPTTRAGALSTSDPASGALASRGCGT